MSKPKARSLRSRLYGLKERYPAWVSAHKPEIYLPLVEQGYAERSGYRKFRITKEGIASFQRRAWTEHDDTELLKLVGKKSTAEIAEILGRPEGGVRGAMRRLGVHNRRFGERHWNAKVSDLLSSMVLTLHEAGFAPVEIQHLVNQERDISRHYIYEVTSCRIRSNPAQLAGQRCSTR